tara:strand:+ start:1756 stop:3507 length:1752 start_codon:yes stop_codon:yes gene_type:complete
MVTIEEFLDNIANTLITNIDTLSGASIDGLDSTNRDFLKQHQKTIRDGITQRMIDDSDRLLIYKRNEKANQEDFNVVFGTDIGGVTFNNLKDIYESFVRTSETYNTFVAVATDNTVTVTLESSSANNSIDITPYIFPSNDGNNPLNISQYIQLNKESPTYDVNSIKEFFDTRIHELLPQQLTRQQRIDAFFKEYEILKGEYPAFADYSDPLDYLIETEPLYNANHDISYIQDNPDSSEISEQSSYITRLNVDTNQKNKSKTLEHLRDDLTLFLKDIDQDTEASLQDERPEYENISDGYLKIRNLNQGIIIRKQEGNDVGIEKDVLIPDSPNPITGNYYHPYYNPDALEGQNYLIPDGYAPSYLVNGFTITMWVKFLDVTTKGTLFNYGNPLRGYDPKGFRLETYVLGKEDLLTSDRNDGYETWGNIVDGESIDGLFQDSDYERFIRLVVLDNFDKSNGAPAGRLYDSHIGITGMDRQKFVPEFGKPEGTFDDNTKGDEKYLLAHIKVPIDFNEWYFIVATYNPMIDEHNTSGNSYLQNSDYWKGNVTENGNYVDNSGLGTKCKVDIISKSDLLRARGFAPEEI